MDGNKTKNTLLWTVFFIFVILLSVVVYCHEPWYDEAQAWMIAREASWWDIFFVRPHFEGHPPLWYLILAVFAKNGAPYELTIKLINTLITAAAVWILLFRSPFPRGIRCILPFTYFIFFQYGVISRPYSLMILAFFLAAAAYRDRNEKPWGFVLSLALLCLSAAYGIIFAGGICLVWLAEIWNHEPLPAFAKRFLHEKRFLALLALLILAVCLILMIIPDEAAYTKPKYSANGLAFRLLFLLIAAPVETICGQSFYNYASLRNAEYSMPAFVLNLFLGILLWALLLWYGKRRKTLPMLLLPMLMFDLFGAVVYMYIHHIGLQYIYLVYWFWISEETGDRSAEPLHLRLLDKLNEHDRGVVVYVLHVSFYVVLLVSVGWTVAASVDDIRYNYGFGRGTAAFLREHDLLDLKIISEWKLGREAGGEDYYDDTDSLGITTPMLPYLTDAEIGNLMQYPSQPYYNSNSPATEEKNQENYKMLKEQGIPDVVLGNCDLEKIYGDAVTMSDYIPVGEVQADTIWKSFPNRQYLHIYLRHDLLEEYGLEYIFGKPGYHFPEDRVRKGVDLQDLQDILEQE